MNTRNLTLAALLGALALNASQAASITNEGATAPTTKQITGNSTEGNLGSRPVKWTSTEAQANGQSFFLMGTGSYTVNAIWVRCANNEDFSAWTSNSLALKILGDPVTRATTSLGDFAYDATALGTVNAGDWLRLELDTGITLNAGVEYSFLLTPGEQNDAHDFSITRQKTSGNYGGGSEMNSASTYDRANWDTDPWDDLDPVGSSITTLGTNLFFYVEGSHDGGALSCQVSLPTAHVLTGDSTEGDLGTRPVEYRTPTTTLKSPARGQSFTVPGSGDFTAQAIWVRAANSEDFSAWTANSLSLKLLGDPATRSTTSLGEFDYDASSTGTLANKHWLRLELGSGVTLSAGTEYSFLLSPGEEDLAHLFNITRQKSGNVYAGGSELNAANAYDRANWDIDPWGDAVSAPATVVTSTSNIFFYVEGVFPNTNPLVITKIDYNKADDEISLWWDAEAGATYTVNWSADLLDFSGEVANDVADTETQPFTFASPSPNADSLFFTVTKNAP